MPNLTIKNKEIKVDEDGFLVNQDEWNEDVAKAILENSNGPELDKETLEILLFMRSYYQKFNAFPVLRSVCKRLDQPRECVQEEFMDPLLAWKAAGLPKPGTLYSESHDEAHKVYKLISAA